MSQTVQLKVEQGRNWFLTHIWPLWRDELQATQIISTEAIDHELRRAADIAGVDAFFARSSSGTLIPISSRIEIFKKPTEHNRMTMARRFTIREQRHGYSGTSRNTEVKRLIGAARDPVSRRYLPYLFIQSLIILHEDSSVEVFFSHAVGGGELADYLDRLLSEGLPLRYDTKTSDATYIAVKADDITASGFKVIQRR